MTASVNVVIVGGKVMRSFNLMLYVGAYSPPYVRWRKYWFSSSLIAVIEVFEFDGHGS